MLHDSPNNYKLSAEQANTNIAFVTPLSSSSSSSSPASTSTANLLLDDLASHTSISHQSNASNNTTSTTTTFVNNLSLSSSSSSIKTSCSSSSTLFDNNNNTANNTKDSSSFVTSSSSSSSSSLRLLAEETNNNALNSEDKSFNTSRPQLISGGGSSSSISSKRVTSGRCHPNIHHHPPIHPHNRYQRLSSSSSTSTTNNSSATTSASSTSISKSNSCNLNMPEELAVQQMSSTEKLDANNCLANVGANECFENEAADSMASSDPLLSDLNDISTKANGSSLADHNDSNEFIETENHIKEIQKVIDKLNSEIFKNPKNCTRPPSEYLEIYHSLTEKLHSLQMKKQKLEGGGGTGCGGDITKNILNDEDNTTSSSEYDKNQYESLDRNEKHHDELNERSISSNSISCMTSSTDNMNTTSGDVVNDVKEKTSGFLPIDNKNQEQTIPTRQKPSHPTSLLTTTKLSSANNFYNSNQLMSSSSPPRSLNGTASGGIRSPLFNQIPPNDSSSNSNFNQTMLPIMESVSANQDNQETNASTQSNHSLNPMSQHHHFNTHNSRSYSDLNDAVIVTPSSATLSSYPTAATPTTSLSPTSSIATTPTTYANIYSSFLRIYIGSSTAVIEKKPIPLKDALFNKLKSRSLEIDKCIAYIKETNLKIEWNTDVNKINSDNIVVAELSDELRHSFEKKTFTLRSCSCKKRILLNVYACIKCDYIMCQRNECKSRCEKIVCVPRKMNLSLPTANVTNNTYKTDIDTFGRSESPIRDPSFKISQQILPVHQLKVSIPSRDRSRSETELNMFINPKLTIDNNRAVQKSPTNIPKSSVVDTTDYTTIPRSQVVTRHINIPNTSVGDISGNANKEMGSVVGRMKMFDLDKSSSSEVDKTPSDVFATPKNINKRIMPSRRDSFNSWEIPIRQIKIDNYKVGSGSFGIVHKGKDFYHGTVAIKFLNVQNPTPQQSYAFRNEVQILKSTRHDNILLFIGCILKPCLAIVTEWCPGSSLYRHLHVEEEHWEMNQLVDIAKQTATGMEYLHAKDILHRDLKSNNIFLIPKETANVQHYRPNNINQIKNGKNDENLNKYNLFNDHESEKWKVKIGDFGLATVKSTWTQTSKTTQPTGSILWMAPEVITQKVSDPYTQKSDVYSFAVVLYELVTGHLPYLKKEQNMILFLVGSGRLRPNPEDARSDTPIGLKELITICSQYDREKRLDFVQINDMLKSINVSKSKSKLQRAQSMPNLRLNMDHTNFNYGGFEVDDMLMFPTTPHLDLISKLHSPT